MKFAQLSAVLMLLAASAVSLSEDTNWVSIGESALGPWQVYVDAESLKKDSNGHVHFAVLDDHRVTQQGIDRVDSNGEMHYDTRFKYRSTISYYVLDCERHLEVFLRIRYFAGDMGTGRLILDEKESDPIWTDLLFEIDDGLTHYACNRVG
jgi:hypothetical protein